MPTVSPSGAPTEDGFVDFLGQTRGSSGENTGNRLKLNGALLGGGGGEDTNDGVAVDSTAENTSQGEPTTVFGLPPSLFAFFGRGGN